MPARRRALRVCPCTGCTAHTGSCPTLVDRGRCGPCLRAADRQRGTRHQRGYGREHEQLFRDNVLRRDVLCRCTDTNHGHGPQCLAPATHADHYPRSRDELVALGLNPNDPNYGRGLCASCDSTQTAHRQPGGWHQAARDTAAVRPTHNQH